MADGSIRFDIELLDKRAKKSLEELDNLVKETGDSLDDELSNKSYKFISDWNNASASYKKAITEMEIVTEQLSDSIEALDISKSLGDTEGISKLTPEISKLTAEKDKLVLQAERYAVQMDKAGIGAKGVTNEIKNANAETSNLNNKTSTLKTVSTQAKETFKGWWSNLKNSTSETSRISKGAQSIGTSFKSSLKSVFRLTTAMLGIRGVITGINRITREWYESNNMGARQAQANMQAMTTGLTNLLAPALSFITGLMAQLMGYINAISVAFFGVNLLTKKASKNMGGVASGTKKAKKEALGFKGAFDEADVASENIANNMDGAGGGGGGAIDLEPNIKTPDLSEFKKSLEEAFAPFIATMKSIDFEPMKKAFNELAEVGKQSAKIISDSFIRTMNNSVAPFIKIMAEDIIPKGLNTITRVLKRMNPVVDDLLKKFVEPLIGWFLLDFAPVGLETVFSIFEAISGILTVVMASFTEFWDSSIGRTISFLAGELVLAVMGSLKEIFDEVTASVDYFLQKLEEGDPIAQALAIAIGAIVSGLIAWKIAQIGINTVTAIFNSLTKFNLVVLAIAAIIAIILILYKNWDDIVAFFEETLENIKQWFADKWQGIKDGFDDLVTAIKTWWDETVQKLKDGWEAFLEKGRNVIAFIKDFFKDLKDGVVNYFVTIGDFWGSILGGMLGGVKDIIKDIKGVFSGLIDFIAGVFTGDWDRAWSGVVRVFDSIVSGIANIFKWPINAMIDGINSFIRGINRIKIPSWVPVVGGKGFSIGQIPRLANGAVLTHQTTAVMAEYPNARTNPEIVSPENKITDIVRRELERANGVGGGGGDIYIEMPIILDGREVDRTIKKINKTDFMQNNGGGLGWNM